MFNRRFVRGRSDVRAAHRGVSPKRFEQSSLATFVVLVLLAGSVGAAALDTSAGGPPADIG